MSRIGQGDSYAVSVRLRVPQDRCGFARRFSTAKLWAEARFGAGAFAAGMQERIGGGEYVTAYFQTVSAAHEVVELFDLPVAELLPSGGTYADVEAS